MRTEGKMPKELDMLLDAGSLALVHVFNIPDKKLAFRVHDALEPALQEAEGYIEDNIIPLLIASKDMTMEQAVAYLEYGAEMVDWLTWTKGLLISTAMHPHERKELKELLTKLEVNDG